MNATNNIARGKCDELSLFVSLYRDGLLAARTVRVPVHFHDESHRWVEGVVKQTMPDARTSSRLVELRDPTPPPLPVSLAFLVAKP